jgi:hypothetical protein
MSCGIGVNSIFGSNAGYIKFQASDLISVQGPNTKERLMLSDLRIPYKQILKSRVIIKPGQVNYLLNHLGLGDNATFLAIVARYNSKSTIEEDNYLQYNYFDDFSNLYSFDQLLVLTGNSTHRVQQLYISNPNTKYEVTLEVMVAVIDDQYSFFTDTVNQSGLSFNNLTYQSIITHIVDESIAILNNDPVPTPIAYIQLSNIGAIERIDRILAIDDTAVGKIYLDFLTTYDAVQAHSLINWVMEAPGRVIQDLNPIADSITPVVYFTPLVNLIGTTFSSPFDTSMGTTFSATMSLSQFGGIINPTIITEQFIYTIIDNRDGYITVTASDINLYDGYGATTSVVVAPGTFSVTFNVTDIADNTISTDEVLVINIGV